MILRSLFGSGDSLDALDDPPDNSTLTGNDIDADMSSDDDSDDDDGNDDDDGDEDDDDNDGDDMIVSEAGMPESASAGPVPLGTPVSASADPVPTPPGDPELASTQSTDDSPSEVTPLESQPLFSSSESQPLTSSAASDPKTQRSESRFGPIHHSIFSRRNPAPMPEALAAIHRKATAPAPIPTGSAARGRSPISGDPPDASLLLSDLGMPDPGSAT